MSCRSQVPARMSLGGYHRPHLRRNPTRPGIGGQPDHHIAAACLQLVPAQVPGEGTRRRARLPPTSPAATPRHRTGPARPGPGRRRPRRGRHRPGFPPCRTPGRPGCRAPGAPGPSGPRPGVLTVTITHLQGHRWARRAPAAGQQPGQGCPGWRCAPWRRSALHCARPVKSRPLPPAPAVPGALPGPGRPCPPGPRSRARRAARTGPERAGRCPARFA